MFKKYLIVGLLIGSLLLSGCNVVTRQLGGTQNITLPENTKLVNMTWKDADLWILTKPMTANDVAETYEFNESSNFGMLEGTVIVKEVKNNQEEENENN